VANQSLLWMALPNGLTEDGGLRVSVLLVPRLDPEEDPQHLRSFPEWVDWPATLAKATFHVTYGGATVSVPAAQVAGADRVDGSLLGAPDSSVWRALFEEELAVRGGPYRDHTSEDVLSYETTEVADLVEDLYGTLAANPGDDLPTVTRLLGQARVEQLVGAMRRIDRAFTDEATGVRDTRRQFDEYRRNRLSGFAGVSGTLARAELFHTPPSKQQVVNQRRRHDDRIDATYGSHEQTELPEREEIADQFDFHQILGAMNSYPTVLRRLGVVVDLVLSLDHFAASGDERLTASVTFAPGALSVARRPDISPETHAALSERGFFAVPDPSSGAAAARIVDGLLELDPSRFDLLQVDVDAAGLKIMNFARALDHLSRGELRVDSVSRKEKRLGAPSLRTAGMMLVQRDRGVALGARFARNAKANGQAQDVIDGGQGPLPELWAEDLIRGFRFDVWDGATEVWRSLCRRTASYSIADAVVVEPHAGEEEGTVRLAATKSPDKQTNQDLIWLHEAIVSWAGWSLAVPPPGRAIKPNDKVGTEAQTEAEIPPGLSFSSRFRAAPGSLPRLRFGRRYWVRARAVDLAGNSLLPRDHDFGPEDPERNARAFLRYEPVAAPVAALVNTGGVTERPAEGESMYRMAIRSHNDTPADNTLPTTERARRFAVPQQVSVREAEHHGVLDRHGAVDSKTFDLLAKQKDRSADDPAAALVEEVISTKGPLDKAPVDTTFAVYKDGEALTYLPDPLAEEVAIRIFGVPGVDPTEVMTVPLYPSGGWPDAQPFKIELVESPGDLPAFDAASRTLRVPLGKGDRALLRTSMKLSRHALWELMGIWQWVTSSTAELERQALDGQHWMLTPWHTLELVHAVQRPLRDPEFRDLIVERSNGETSARPRFQAHLSIKSTDRLDLLADWHEPDDRAPGALLDLHRGDTAFSLKVTSPDEYEAKSAENRGGGTPDHRISGIDEIDVGLEWPGSKSHEFHDTRYRRIEYWLQATTKFREYLPEKLATDEEKITVVGDRRVTWIRSSAPPPAPEVLYVVPTFGWSRSRDEDGNASSHRRGGGLRVYLDRPWNVSGYGEMLAVVLAPSDFEGEPESDPAGHPYKKLVTQWGNDPIWESPFVRGIAPSRSSFPLARTAPDTAGGWLPKGAPGTEADQPSGEFTVTGLGSPEARLEIAPHDVFYDPERELWYCDIEIDQGASYWPMVRLAVARYQPVSVSGAELSEVVLVDVMPLVADRWLNVRRGGEGRVHVAVFGNTFSNSSGSQEASQARAYSRINRLTGETRSYEPTEVSPTTVVEVWIEALDAAKGEDFGWERVSAQVVRGGEVGDRGVPRRHFIPEDRGGIAQMLRAQKLRREGRFAEFATSGLPGNITGLFTLWDGTIDLPRGLDARLRLVVAEYEEYIVDDEAPYDDVPEEKGRRLVFVEHVQLE
jgi:hypothetical protein